METWTPNQLVSFNLRRIRHIRGWTQEKAAAELAPFLGAKWSKAVWSAAETSHQTETGRQFTVTELIAMSKAFNVPLGWWFLPPEEDEDLAEVSALPDVARALPIGELLVLVFEFWASEELRGRLKRVVAKLPEEWRDEIAAFDLVAEAGTTDLTKQLAQLKEELFEQVQQLREEAKGLVAYRIEDLPPAARKMMLERERVEENEVRQDKT